MNDLSKDNFPFIWVLNLKRSIKRKEYIKDLLDDLNLNYEIIEAINGNYLTKEQVKLYSHKEAKKHFKERQIKKIFSRGLTLGQLGCSLSHIFLWEKMIKENQAEIIILEDDALLGSSFKEIIKRRHLFPKDWEFIQLDNAHCSYQEHFGDFIYDIHRMSFLNEKMHNCTAYLLKLSAAIKLVKFAYPIRMPADIITRYAIFRSNLKIKAYGIEPRIAHIANLTSDIFSVDKVEKDTYLSKFKKIMIGH